MRPRTLVATALVGMISLALLVYVRPEPGANEAATVAAKANRGLFWEVSEVDGDSDRTHQIHLLGSIHFANDSFYPLSSEIMQAWQASEVLLVEVDESLLSAQEQRDLINKNGYYQEGESLLTKMTPATQSMLKALLADFGLSLQDVSHWRPGLLVASLTAMQAQHLGYDAGLGIDRYFLDLARGSKTVRQIESFAAQMALLAELPDDDDSLRRNFEQMRDYDKTWEATVLAWKQGDAASLYEYAIAQPLREAPELEDFFDTLFFDRHPKMLAAVESCFSRQEHCFVVLGAGHMVGPEGLVDALKQRGYRVQQR